MRQQPASLLAAIRVRSPGPGGAPACSRAARSIAPPGSRLGVRELPFPATVAAMTSHNAFESASADSVPAIPPNPWDVVWRRCRQPSGRRPCHRPSAGLGTLGWRDAKARCGELTEALKRPAIVAANLICHAADPGNGYVRCSVTATPIRRPLECRSWSVVPIEGVSGAVHPAEFRRLSGSLPRSRRHRALGYLSSPAPARRTLPARQIP